MPPDAPISGFQGDNVHVAADELLFPVDEALSEVMPPTPRFRDLKANLGNLGVAMAQAGLEQLGESATA